MRTSEVDNKRFLAAYAASEYRTLNGIGTLNEQRLHNALKHYYEPDESCHEVALGGYVADILNADGVIEIQTGSFGKMCAKLEHFLEYTHVTIVYPCVVKKMLLNIDPDTGNVVSHRKSTSKHNEYDALGELCGITSLLTNERLDICITMLEEEEYRIQTYDNEAKNRRGVKTYDIVELTPTSIVGEAWLRCPADYLELIPEKMPTTFSTLDFSRLAKISKMRAGSAVRLLHGLGILERVGKRGNAFLYSISPLYS